MANAKKLPSGNWRCRATKIVNGKKTTKSFTAKAKKEAERLADEWQNHIDMIGTDSTTMTVEEAIQEYINIKSNVLSASTILGYKRYLKNGFEDIKNLKLYQLNSIVIQKSINFHSEKLSQKTLKNYYGLLLSTLRLFYPELTLSITFPQKEKKEKKKFSKQYINDLLTAIKGTKIELPALLAITLSCRASEVAGLKWSDVDFQNHTIHIQRAKVNSENGYIVQNKNKNITSNRIAYIPDILYNKLKEEKPKATTEFLTNIPSNQYYQILHRITTKANIEPINFHSLRHMTASIMLDIGINNQVAQEIGGWATDNILKSVYQHTFTESRKSANESINNYFNAFSVDENLIKKRFKLTRKLTRIS